MNICRPALFVFLSVAIAGSSSGAVGTYHVTDLGFGSPGYAIDINSYGQVVGYDASHAYLWTPTSPNGTAGSPVDLGVRPDGAFGINDYGQVVGGAYFDNSLHAFLWTPATPNGATGSAVDLGILPGRGSTSVANDINRVGQVVGRSGADVAFVWTPTSPNGTGGVMTALDMPSVAQYSVAQAINNSGQVTGYYEGDRAFLWTPSAPNGSSGTSVDLGVLSGNGNTKGYGINNAGKVVGDSEVSLGHAFLWTPDSPNGSTGSMIDLGGVLSGAYDINSLDHIVGTADGNAFIRTPSDGMVNLNQHFDSSGAGWTLDYAIGINDFDQIVGYGTKAGVGTRGFLLTPVPEPAAVFVFVLASFFITLSRRPPGAAPASSNWTPWTSRSRLLLRPR